MEVLSQHTHPSLDQFHYTTTTTTGSSEPLDHMSSADSPPSSHYLKMEDLHHHSLSPAPDSYDNINTGTPSVSQSSPPPVFVQSKPAKKRKSWGQELPEPKTTLPPRKRAKTDDEKEQRRIERIKRNRAAAHNSRERKRQETETLAVALAKANAELEAYKKLHGPLPKHIVLPEVHLSVDPEPTPSASTPAPSLVESHGSLQDPPSPASPADNIFHTTPQIKQEPLESSFPTNLPPAFDHLDAKSTLFSQLDSTQHSAEMLCDLPCRSSTASSSSTTLANSWWTNLFLFLTTLQFQTCYRTLLVALWTLSPSRMARLMQASMLRSTSRSTISSTRTTRLLWSTPRRLALYNAATGPGAPREGALSLDRERTSRLEQASDRRAQQAPHHRNGGMAFGEQHVGAAGKEDQSMADDGDENGVRRGELA